MKFLTKLSKEPPTVVLTLKNILGGEFIMEKNKNLENYIKYTYYDELGKKNVIIKENTPVEIIKILKENFYEVKFKE